MNKELKSKYVYEVFQNISTKYDSANTRISLGLQKQWKNFLVKQISDTVPAEGSLVDICCGTGDIAIWCAQKRKDIKVTGMDFSPAMLKVAKEKSGQMDNVCWIEGDALSLPFPDNSFSAACISFGLRNTSDYEKVIAEIKRVIKENGTIYCLDSFVPDNKLIQPFYKLYFKYFMPLLGGGKTNYKEYLWLYKSTHDFLRKDELISLYEKVGLKDIKFKSKMFGACVLVQGKK